MSHIFVLEAKNPRWSNAKETAVDLDVNFSHMPEEWVAFTATPDDSTTYGPVLFNNALKGLYGPIEKYTPPNAAG